MRYVPRPAKSYTDAEGDDYWPGGECEGREVEITDDEPTGVFDSRGNMLWRQKPICGFNLSSK